jgi:hypothetical protein
MITTLSIPELLGIDATSIVVDRILAGVPVDFPPWPEAVARKIGHPSLLFWALYNEPMCIPILFRQNRDAPIDWTVMDDFGNTLLVAAIFQEPRFCQDIIAAGHLVDTLQTDGLRPLIHAVNAGGYQPSPHPGSMSEACLVVHQIIQAGANVDAIDTHGWTALAHAVGRGDPDKVRVLLDAGASMDLVDPYGRTLENLFPTGGEKTERAVTEIRALLVDTARRRLEAQLPDPLTPVKSSLRL